MTALLLALMLAGCAGDRLTRRTKCETVSAVLSNPSATRDQIAIAMEMGGNNGCCGTGPPRQPDKRLESPFALSVPPPIGAAFDATVMAATPIEGMGEAGAGTGDVK
ncbi:hypothetical protein SAMN05443248_1636 [Bradyrhizobium erythrophlei]|uniref:Uncharacterized protein n=1 Tax=Bradyrhizobium erythrophlei TaxID=1437360 RepID=A0A1M5K1K5_9BRAD|nr:hypothetical protein SAMN05443248_1636 [Bradyrhizobium erythrophlei]